MTDPDDDLDLTQPKRSPAAVAVWLLVGTLFYLVPFFGLLLDWRRW